MRDLFKVIMVVASKHERACMRMHEKIYRVARILELSISHFVMMRRSSQLAQSFLLINTYIRMHVREA